MASTANCYYCDYPLQPAAAVCPECGAPKDFGPSRGMHRTTTNAWLALGLVLVIVSLGGVTFTLELLTAPPSLGAPPLLPLWVGTECAGFAIGVATIAWAVRAKLRKHAAPRFAVFLTVSLFLYLLAKLSLFVLHPLGI